MNKEAFYTGIFFDENLHMTWHFDIDGNAGFPEHVKEGDSAEVEVLGQYEDEEVACFIVRWKGLSHNPQETLLHITTKALIEAQYSGIRATKNGWKELDAPYILKGVWKYGELKK